MTLEHVLSTCGLHQLSDLTTSLLLTCLSEETIIHISSGHDHSAVVCESGRAYTLRAGAHGAEPCPLPAGSRALRAACGRGFTILLCEGGELFSWGDNVYGQLGLGGHEPAVAPRRVLGLPRVARVAAGAYHAVALTPTGEVWVCGLNVDGQLGLGHDDAQASFARVFSVSHPILEVACGHYHTALLSASRVLLVAGCNNAGQLGLGPTARQNVYSYTAVYLPPVTAVTCGSNHTVVTTEDGTAWTWGANSAGQLGNGSDSNCSSPYIVPGLETHPISDIFAGCDRTAMVSQDGNVFLCGKGISEEPDKTDKDHYFITFSTSSRDTMVKYISFTSSYTLMLTLPEFQESFETNPKSINVCESENSTMNTTQN